MDGGDKPVEQPEWGKKFNDLIDSLDAHNVSWIGQVDSIKTFIGTQLAAERARVAEEIKTEIDKQFRLLRIQDHSNGASMLADAIRLVLQNSNPHPAQPEHGGSKPNGAGGGYIPRENMKVTNIQIAEDPTQPEEGLEV